MKTKELTYICLILIAAYLIILTIVISCISNKVEVLSTSTNNVEVSETVKENDKSLDSLTVVYNLTCPICESHEVEVHRIDDSYYIQCNNCFFQMGYSSDIVKLIEIWKNE